jgi:hypothetical protein
MKPVILLIFSLVQTTTKQNTTEGQYSLNFQNSTSSINLTIIATYLGNSAVYFCLLRETSVREKLAGASHKLQLEQESTTDGEQGCVSTDEVCKEIAAQFMKMSRKISRHISH